MVRIASSFILAALPLHAGALVSEDEIVLLQTHNTVKPRGRRMAEHEHRAQALAQTYENMVRDVITRGPENIPTDAVLNPAINQFADLKEELKNDRETQQGAVDEANAALSACNDRRTVAYDTPNTGINALKSATAEARDTHKQCRADENTLAGDRDAKCGAFSAAASGHQCNSEDWLSANGDGLVAAAKACVEGKTGIVDTEQKCDRDQQAFEGKFCAYASALQSACDSYAECRAEETERRTATYDEAKELEASHKRIWVAYEKAVCFLNLLKDARGDALTEEKLQGCISLVPDTSDLDMNYPDASDGLDCDKSSISNKPGEDAWRTAEYGSSPFSENPEHLQATELCPQGSFEVPDEHLQKCAHEDEWEYVVDYGDDRNTDDIPDDSNVVAAGFSNKNAYYIGNAKLEELELEEVQVCALISSDSCKKNCYTLSGNLDNWGAHGFPNTIPNTCASDLSTPLKKVISILAGGCANQPHFWLYEVPNEKFSTFEGTNIGWQCRGYRGWYTHGGLRGGWHAQGWGISLSNKGHVGPHMNSAGWEFGWWGGTCGHMTTEANPDVFQIRVKVAK